MRSTTSPVQIRRLPETPQPQKTRPYAPASQAPEETTGEIDAASGFTSSSPLDFPAATPLPLGRLRLMVDPEPALRVAVGQFLAAAVIVAWFLAVRMYWAPAHPGVDQNGYLVGGRMFADHLSTGVQPPDVFAFVSNMWNGTPWGVFYPKYPLGLPVIYAVALKIGATGVGRASAYFLNSPGWVITLAALYFVLRALAAGGLRKFQFTRGAAAWAAAVQPLTMASTAILLVALAMRWLLGPFIRLHVPLAEPGVVLAHDVSPVCMALALAATFRIARFVCGSVGALLATVALACSPVTLGLAINPNSHAATLFCVTWGVYLLLRWWQGGGAARAAGAGLLLGYAAAIRYTEALLVLPALLAIVLNVRWTYRRSLVEAALLLAWWAMPILALVCFNLGAFGDFTGYDSTHESGFGMAFTWGHVRENWELTLRDLHDTGLFFLLPLAVAGMVLMFAHARQAALFFAAWVLPGLLLYTSYYWAPDGNAIGYLRFFLTILPPLAIAAYWLMAIVIPAALSAMHRRGDVPSIPAALVAALIASCGAAAVAYSAAASRGLPEDKITPAVAWAAVSAYAAAMLIAGAWLALSRFKPRLAYLGRASSSAGCIAAGLMTLACAGVALYVSGPALENDYRADLACAVAADELNRVVAAPKGSVVLAWEEQILNHLQFAGNFRAYDERAFDARFISRLRDVDPDTVHPMQAERAQDLYRMLHKLSPQDLFDRRNQVLLGAMKEGRRVFAVVRRDQWNRDGRFYFPMRLYRTQIRTAWCEPVAPIPDRPAKNPWRPQPPAVRRWAPPQTGLGVWQIVEIFASPDAGNQRPPVPTPAGASPPVPRPGGAKRPNPVRPVRPSPPPARK